MTHSMAIRTAAPVELARDLVPVLRMHTDDADQHASFPAASVQALRDSGLLGLMVPTRHGGLGGGLRDLVDVAGVLASGCLSTAMIWAMHSQQVDSVVRYGTARLLDELLPQIAAGTVYLASVTTEPGSGGRILTASSYLREAEGLVVVDRQAPIVTGGRHADGFLITMRDGSDVSGNRVTLVYAARDQLRLEGGGDWNPLGMRATESVGLRLSGEIPPHQIVGDRGRYRTVAVESMIPAAHLGWAACWIGTARSALADVVALIRSPRRPRSLDPDSPLVAVRLARVRADLELASAYLDRVTDEVTELRDAGRTLGDPHVQIHLNTLKVVASELAFRAVDGLVQVTGLSVGYLRASTVPLERHFRDLRSASLNIANDRLLTANGALSLLDRGVRLVGGPADGAL